MRHLHENIVRIKAVHEILGPLREQIVFVGGATVSLYAQRQAASIRETHDVDILVEIVTNWEYAAVEEQLRQVGFSNVLDSAFVGRYQMQGLIVDLMSTDERILGFSNRWYKEGFQTAIDHRIDDLVTVKIFDAPHFIASKIEAFRNRGRGDGRTSADFEDIVFILDNRPHVWDEMEVSNPLLKNYLKTAFLDFENNPYIEEWIGCHSSFYSPPSAYLIRQDMQAFLAR